VSESRFLVVAFYYLTPPAQVRARKAGAYSCARNQGERALALNEHFRLEHEDEDE
jgi:hypothetical protein